MLASLDRLGPRDSHAISQYFSEMSIPMLFRAAWAASHMIVPDPTNGSSTVSPTKLNMRMIRRANSLGKGAGWLRLDVPGMVQICLNHWTNKSFGMTLYSLCWGDGRL